MHPYFLPTSFRSGFDTNIYVRANSNPGAYAYRVDITDSEDNVSSATFDIESEEMGTPVTLIEGVLFNASGPGETGGCDLDTGVSTTSSDVTAEIKDEGIDTNQPVATNWKRQISGANGYNVRYVDPATFADGSSFAAVTTREQIILIYDAVDDSNNLTPPLVVGDVLAITNGTNYYLVNIKQVNELDFRPDGYGDNGDNYVLDIKK